MQALLQKYILNYILKYGGQLIMDLLKHFMRSLEQRKALDHVEEVAKNPDATALEIGEAYAKAINAGRG